MSELIIAPVRQVSTGIRLRQGVISYDNYQQDLEKAREIAERIREMEPTEENMKEAKALIARARHVTDGINRVRINIKKTMLEPYEQLQAMVKEITGTIDSAENTVRDKVKALEEQERWQKRETLRGIWDSRARWYAIAKAMPDSFDNWLEPRHLNKTVTVKTCEAEMTAWLERMSKELETCMDMGPEYMSAFLQTLDMTAAVARVNDTRKKRQALKEADEEQQYVNITAFYVEGEKDIALAEMLLNQHKIRYHKEDM